MDPEERIRRREERRRRRQSDKSFEHQENGQMDIKTVEDYKQDQILIKQETNSETMSRTEQESNWNCDENHNGTKEEEVTENQLNGYHSESTTSVEGDQEIKEPEIATVPHKIITAPSKADEPEALNVYKEMKMKNENDESMENARIQLHNERIQLREELELLKKRKAERARQWEEADRIQKQHAEDRYQRQQAEEQRLKQEFEKKKNEREIRMKKMAHNPYAYQAPVVKNGESSFKFGIKKREAHEREKKKVLAERVPPLDINATTSKEELRKLAEDLIQKLKTANGKFFDLEYQTERSKYTIHELKIRIKAMNKYSYEQQAKASYGGLSNIVKQLEQARSTEGSPTSRRQQEKQAGSILSSGGVKARLAMFGGGSLNQSNEETRKHQVDLTK